MFNYTDDYLLLGISFGKGAFMELYYWLILFVVFAVVEIATMGLATIWFAAGALCAFMAGFAGVSLVGQIIIFLVISIVLLIFTRPVAEKYLNKTRIKTNVESLVGKEGKVVENIDNFNQTGKILLNGMEWTARSTNDDVKIPVESGVKVVEIKGVKAFVEPSSEKEA